MSTILEMRDVRLKRRELYRKMEGMALTQREFTPEETAAFEALRQQVEALDERLMALEDQQVAVEEGASRSSRRLTGPVPIGRNVPGQYSQPEGCALRSWLRIGTPLETQGDRRTLERAGYSAGAHALEFRAQSHTAGAGNELVPSTLWSQVNQSLKAFAPIRNLAQVINTSGGETLRVPTVDDTSNSGAIVAENAAHAEQDAAFTEIAVGAYTYSSKLVRVSNELLQDSAIDLAAFLGAILGERIGRIQSAHFMTGTNSGQPQGVVSGAGTVAAASATAISTADLINLVAAIDPSYLADGTGQVGWMMHPIVWGAIRKLADSNGQPLVQPIVDRGPATLLGYPVTISTEMDSTFANTKKSVLFGNFRHYLIRDAGSLSVARSNERYFEYNQSAFIALYRTDAKVLQAGAFKVLLHST